MKKGFSIIEILIVLAIIGILSVLVLGTLGGFRKDTILETATERIYTSIREAQNLTFASKDSNQYGVHLATSSVTLFVGNTYSESDPENEVYNLENGIEIVEIDLVGGGNNIVFEKLTGETTNYGTTTVGYSDGSGETRSIYVEPSGVVEIN